MPRSKVTESCQRLPTQTKSEHEVVKGYWEPLSFVVDYNQIATTSE